MFKRNKPTESVQFIFLDEAKAPSFASIDPVTCEISTEVPFNGDITVLELALNNDIDLSHSCGGMGSCGTCRVLIPNSSDQKKLGLRNDLEQEIATERNFTSEERLACQIHACSGLKVHIP